MIVPLSTQNRDTGSSSNHPEQTDAPKPRLLDQVRDTIRRKHYSIRTEQSYIDWIKRFIYFHDKQHPRDLNESHITAFLNGQKGGELDAEPGTMRLGIPLQRGHQEGPGPI